VESFRSGDERRVGAREHYRYRIDAGDTMKPLSILVVFPRAVVALIGYGSSSDKGSSASPASAKAPPSAQDQAATQLCSARDGIDTQVRTPSSLRACRLRGPTSPPRCAINTDLQKITDAQPDLVPERKPQVQDAATAFGMQLKDILRQTVAGLSKTDAQTQANAQTRAKNAAASLKSAVKESLQPIQC
jgi:hypothetical protein